MSEKQARQQQQLEADKIEKQIEEKKIAQQQYEAEQLTDEDNSAWNFLQPISKDGTSQAADSIQNGQFQNLNAKKEESDIKIGINDFLNKVEQRLEQIEEEKIEKEEKPGKHINWSIRHKRQRRKIEKKCIKCTCLLNFLH